MTRPANRLGDPVEPLYTIGLSGFITDPTIYANLFLDTVFVPVRKATGRIDAMTIAGCHVMTIARATSGDGVRFPERYGKIQSYRAALPVTSDPGRVVILGKKATPSDTNVFIWCGTVAEYEKTWECD